MLRRILVSIVDHDTRLTSLGTGLTGVAKRFSGLGYGFVASGLYAAESNLRMNQITKNRKRKYEEKMKMLKGKFLQQ